MSYERITVEDVQVGDRVARTRTETFDLVEKIDEGPATRRLHFASEPCSEPGFSAGESTSRYCRRCFRSETAIVREGHGKQGGGNIRPRRTAKLWREVV